MSRRLLIAVSLVLIGATNSFAQNVGDFEGSKAGDRREVAPGIFCRWCPAGKFAMGEDGRNVDVELTKGFWLGETEVTQKQWHNLLETTPWKGVIKEGEEYPVSYVRYYEALGFCKKLTSRELSSKRMPQGWKYTLPTEAQWEYACRAGTTTKFSFGDDDSKLGQYCWFGGKPNEHPYPVGNKKANNWGINDMHGNVWEWCSDWSDTPPQGGRDPQGPATGSYAVNRGGSWFNDADFCRTAMRSADSPDNRSSDLGFRLVAIPFKE